MCVVRDVCVLYCCIVYITNLNWIQYCLLVTGGDGGRGQTNLNIDTVVSCIETCCIYFYFLFILSTHAVRIIRVWGRLLLGCMRPIGGQHHNWKLIVIAGIGAHTRRKSNRIKNDIDEKSVTRLERQFSPNHPSHHVDIIVDFLLQHIRQSHLEKYGHVLVTLFYGYILFLFSGDARKIRNSKHTQTQTNSFDITDKIQSFNLKTNLICFNNFFRTIKLASCRADWHETRDETRRLHPFHRSIRSVDESYGPCCRTVASSHVSFDSNDTV